LGDFILDPSVGRIETLDLTLQLFFVFCPTTRADAVLSGRRDGTEFRIFDGLLDGSLRGGVAWLLGQVGASNLEAIEQQAGALGVYLAEADALQDMADGDLDGRAVFGVGQGEAVVEWRVEAFTLDRLAPAVVVVAEGLWALRTAQCGRGAAAAVRKDVTAKRADFLGFGDSSF
jgi:hypothetical protein